MLDRAQVVLDLGPRHRQTLALDDLEDRRHDQRGRREDQHRRLRRCGSAVEGLLIAAQAADEHRGAQHEQHVAQDRAHDRRLDHLLQPGQEREEGDQQLGQVAERHVEQAPDAGAQAIRQLLGGPAHEGRRRDDADRRGGEDQRRAGVHQLQDHGDGDERNEGVRPAVAAQQSSLQVTHGASRRRSPPPPWACARRERCWLRARRPWPARSRPCRRRWHRRGPWSCPEGR